MRSYNPEKNLTADPKEIIKDFFQSDLTEPDSFFTFKRDLIDYFSVRKEERKTQRPFWLLSVYVYWNFLSKISVEESVNNLVEQIPDAARLGVNVFKEFIFYIKSKFFDEGEMQTYYSKIRDQVIRSEVPVGLSNSEMTLATLYKEIELLNSYGDDAMRVAQFYDKLQSVLFNGTDGDPINEYIDVDRGEAVQSLVNLMNFIFNTEPKYIYPAADAEEFYFTTRVDPASTGAQIGIPPPDMDQLLESPALKAIPIPELPKDIAEQEPIMRGDVTVEDLYKEYGVPLSGSAAINAPSVEGARQTKISAQPAAKKEKTPTTAGTDTVAKPAPAPEVEISKPALAPKTEKAKPAYAEIKNKIDSAFAKDAQGDYQDIEGLMDALQKAADKYNDPKIAELLYWDEGKGKFEWNV